MPTHIDPWHPNLNWDTPSGKVLRKLVDALPSHIKPLITVFGSAPIQMGIDSGLVSADVDIFAEEDLKEVVEKNNLGKNQSNIYIQVCSELNFRTSPKWQRRVYLVQFEKCVLQFPHPIDILIAKLNRAEEKDLHAFEIVLKKTGHPTEAELLEELRDAVDLYRPGFDEENATDLVANTKFLWKRLYKKEINPRTDIIQVALQRRKEGYGEPPQDLKQELRNIAKKRPPPKKSRKA